MSDLTVKDVAALINGLQKKTPLGFTIRVADYRWLLEQKPVTFIDNTIHGGAENYELFVLTEAGVLKEVPAKFGLRIIQQASNMSAYEVDDDVDQTGEDIASALARFHEDYKLVVLHRWGNPRRIKGSEKDFEDLFISP